MNKTITLGELFPYIITSILIFSFKFSCKNWNLYLFWQPIIDNVILLMLLIFMLLNSNTWYWISKRLLYGLIFILLLNTYSKLFGLDPVAYYHWYVTPLVAILYSSTIAAIIEVSYKLYTIKKWK